MRVDYELVLAAWKARVQLNETPIDQLEIHEEGRRVPIDPESLRRWQLTGMTNFDFIVERAWEPGYWVLDPPAATG